MWLWLTDTFCTCACAQQPYTTASLCTPFQPLQRRRTPQPIWQLIYQLIPQVLQRQRLRCLVDPQIACHASTPLRAARQNIQLIRGPAEQRLMV
jgi:hypothetical protein